MDEKKMILKMIEEGKITAEEGFALITALDKKNTKEDDYDFFEDDGEGSEQTKKDNREQYNKFKDDLHDATEKIIGSANKGASKLMDFIGKAVEKVQNLDLDLDLDFNIGGGAKVTEVIQIQNFKPTEIDFSVSNGSLRINPWEKDYAQLEVNAVVSRTKDEAEARRALEEILEHSYVGDSFMFKAIEKKGIRLTIEVMLPLHIYQSLHVSSNNGSIRLNDFEINEVKLITTNGSIRVNDVIGLKVDGQTSNGRIQFNQAEFKQCDLQTSNGSIHLRKVDVEQASCQTTNGSIQAGGQLKEFTCGTTNGSIRLEQTSEENSKIQAETSNGLIRVTFPRLSRGVYGELNTNHGQINVQIPHTRVNIDEESSKLKAYHFEQGEEQRHQVKAKTNTGSIQIVEREAD
ncbi:DUF4097 family beta strand repeat-containing protein [Bacillus horti]|uniref:DUF4097 and DUF4098 domain-containing protein YvlB n=1 Tax=Caldalkalibacillus horti TaxID=77523 RepID=A0ABT9W5B0_9BACI|nr:DUF4097 family beta strand repeat-containing protein [Bacillus horti]MDQ0168434.1 DUF4097 and DUF4098 domain-containing protein YvlB [Bacillus horti]